jgi:hypothetical protein
MLRLGWAKQDLWGLGAESLCVVEVLELYQLFLTPKEITGSILTFLQYTIACLICTLIFVGCHRIRVLPEIILG